MKKPSKFQEAIFSFIETGTGNAIVSAVAGSGKTTTLVDGANKISRTKRCLFLAFNKKIQMELAARLPKHVMTQTINSLGHQAWMNANPKCKLDTAKTLNILKALRGNYDATQFDRIMSNVRKMVSVAKANGLAPLGMTGVIADTDAEWNRLIDHYDILFNGVDEGVNVQLDRETAIQIARVALKKSVEIKDVIDFDDQIFMTVIYNIPVPKYDWVFVDEAQDVSEIQRALIAKAMAKYTRSVFVGDEKQAIYGFRGADSESLNNIGKQFNAINLPLSISYRCAKAIVAEARQYVGHIEASENAPEGLVEELGDYKTDMFKMNDMVVCRNTAPLVKLAYKLISEKVPAKVEGKDLASGLVNLINKMNAKTILQLNEKLHHWKDRETARLKQADPEADISGVEDKFDVLQVFMESSAADTVPVLISAIESLFGDEVKDCVRLSTVHRAKGLEAERVFILDKWLMPSRYAVKPWMVEQENNLIYVALTRAKTYLGYVETPRPKTSKKFSDKEE